MNILYQHNVVNDFLVQQNVLHEGCSRQYTQAAIDAIKEIEERRHQEVLLGINTQTTYVHQTNVAQLTGDAARRLKNKYKDTTKPQKSLNVKPSCSKPRQRTTCPTNKPPKPMLRRHTTRCYASKLLKKKKIGCCSLSKTRKLHLRRAMQTISLIGPGLRDG